MFLSKQLGAVLMLFCTCAQAGWQLADVSHFYANDPATSGVYRSQGIATDGDKWFFSWQYGLERADRHFISEQRNSSFQWPSHLSPGIPANLWAQGLDHIGDIDYHNGLIYASLDSSNGYRQPHVALFNAADLSYTGQSYSISGSPANPNNDVASWFAIDAARGLAYGKEYRDGDSINVYSLSDWSFQRAITLDTHTRSIQGAKVSGDWLYMSSDNSSQSIYRANLLTGQVENLFNLPTPEGEREVEGLALRDNGQGGVDIFVEMIVDPKGTGLDPANDMLRVDLYRYSISPVPEPESWVLMVGGVGFLATRFARRKKS
jgi:hypothetical protein